VWAVAMRLVAMRLSYHLTSPWYYYRWGVKVREEVFTYILRAIAMATAQGRLFASLWSLQEGLLLLLEPLSIANPPSFSCYNHKE
jgi:hypothetical protein